MRLTKKQLFSELDKLIPNNAVIDVEGVLTEPGNSVRSVGYGGVPTNIVLGSEITDIINLTVKYYQRCYE